ncbi:ATP-binding cassette domain-containing protein [Kitasatospora sp. NPDC093806]|uniref:ATP-binding cassette domain-containing protein n=1 Tax=Kitasatospora sp. NPDC093806 TaxID=3155075 RepID=UPI003443D8FA
MIQITGLTKVYRRGAPPAVLDLTFDARPGMVTALLGPEEAGKSTALRLMLELERGHGVTLFDGRTYRRLRRPEREVGVVLPGPGGATGAADTAGHPGRKAHGHLRMLAAAVGVPARRADELLEQTRLAAVADQRLRTFSPGMHRRLALAAALLGDPGTLLLDAPTEGLSPRNVEWFHSFLRSFGVAGGTVLVTTRSPQEAARLADRVVTLDQGRLVADQPVTEFRRTRISPEVAVRGPQMARLADLLVGQGAQVRRDGGAGLAVAGIGRTEIGELAYRHGILLHELADRVVEQPAPRATLPVGSGRTGNLQVQAGPEPVRPPRPAPPARPDHPVGKADGRASADAAAVVDVADAAGGTAERPADRTVAMPVAKAAPLSVPAPQTAERPAPVEQPVADDHDHAPAPTLALPVAAVPVAVPVAVPGGLSAATALSALTSRPAARTAARRAAGGGAPAETADGKPGSGAAESGTPEDAVPGAGQPESAQPEEEASPVVAVDRLFRDGLTDLARSAEAPLAEPGEDRPAAAADLLTDDTIRLGRLAHPGEREGAEPAPAGEPERTPERTPGWEWVPPGAGLPAVLRPGRAAHGPSARSTPTTPTGPVGQGRGGAVAPVTSDHSDLPDPSDLRSE